MRVLITGGAGYVGSHTAREFSKRGYGVRLYDNFSTGHPFFAQGFETIVADINDRLQLLSALRNVDAVIHFAAHAYIAESVKCPRKYFENNVIGGLKLLNAAVDVGVPHFVFSSTCAVYGCVEEVPIKEETPKNPINPYGASKLAFEHMLAAYSRAYGIGFTSLRYFNAAGADESGDLGELHDPEPHLIPSVLKVAAGLTDILDIYGDDYPTPDGTCVRDYIHVSDLAAAHVSALEHLQRGGESLALNLGTGIGHSILEVISAAERVTGRAVRRRVQPRRPGDPPVLVADPANAERILGWRATRSLPDIVKSAWQWMQRCQQLAELSAHQ